MSGVSKNDWKGLWAVFWRTFVFGPAVWIFGLALLLLVFAAFILPPLYAVLAFFTGDWFWGILALTGWLIVLRFRRPILHWALEGIECGGL